MTSTRDRVLAEIRQGPKTIRALTETLAVTRTAIVVQVNQLLAENLIRKGTPASDGSVGKPALRYEAVPGYEDSMSEAYQPFSELLVSVLSQGLSDDAFDSLMRRLGWEMADHLSIDETSDFDDRLSRARDHVDQLGAATQAHQDGDHIIIESHNCPVASLVRKNGCVCTAVGQFFETATGQTVDVQCDRSDRLTCRFRIKAA
ncbi:helix-turn-helix transcriptional regulator [Coralliovum pocilloporae]|uniref:helix-turn-helix transcriptional regulator n=1 Tax=Coralliovum pocilloporae TaxID=3066369 RepID=UPI003307A008